MKRQRHTEDEQGTIAAGGQLAAHLSGGSMIALEGPLGAGKTCLARGIAMGLGVDARSVASPTFAIVHEHETSGVDGICRLYHLDAYRLSGAEDLESIGWSEIIGDREGVVLVEWGSRIEPALPPACHRIDVSYSESDGRWLQLRSPEGDRCLGRIWDEADGSLGVGG